MFLSLERISFVFIVGERLGCFVLDGFFILLLFFSLGVIELGIGLCLGGLLWGSYYNLFRFVFLGFSLGFKLRIGVK